MMKLIALVFLFLLSSPGFCQTKLKFAETYAGNTTNHLDSVLILGMGSTTTRIFLDELSDKFSKAFKSAHIMSSYFYLGQDTTAAKKELADPIQLKNYKIILTLFPKGESLFRNNSSTQFNFMMPGNRFVPLPNASTITSYVYEQAFDFKLYANDEKMTRIWAASIFIEGDISRNHPTTKLSDKVIGYFHKHNYLP